MFGVLVRFQFGTDFNADKLRAIAEKARGRFEGMPGLISKAFTIDAEQRAAVNFYVWESERKARDFFTTSMLEQVTGIYGVKPALEFLEIAQQVGNA
jgi:heme-degrading monooxygenase HmoA